MKHPSSDVIHFRQTGIRIGRHNPAFCSSRFRTWKFCQRIKSAPNNELRRHSARCHHTNCLKIIVSRLNTLIIRVIYLLKAVHGWAYISRDPESTGTTRYQTSNITYCSLLVKWRSNFHTNDEGDDDDDDDDDDDNNNNNNNNNNNSNNNKYVYLSAN